MIARIILMCMCFIFLYDWTASSIKQGSFEGRGIDANIEQYPGLFGYRAMEESIFLILLGVLIIYDFIKLLRLILKRAKK
ncbi:hypothetical protein N7931_06270 [Catenovulum sp. 2E275]|uniref:hypothetical protein n=1 Tax=Catenovulum sp. 2E275 TaxID=2980497 RepID=UPI0021D020C6|nr:hypothetical protein [Catenovulum sp. 2E275]MCU4675235.1 hypothetical protein [Catenovulum sp. 2E275]